MYIHVQKMVYYFSIFLQDVFDICHYKIYLQDKNNIYIYIATKYQIHLYLLWNSIKVQEKTIWPVSKARTNKLDIFQQCTCTLYVNHYFTSIKPWYKIVQQFNVYILFYSLRMGSYRVYKHILCLPCFHVIPWGDHFKLSSLKCLNTCIIGHNLTLNQPETLCT